VSGQLHALTTLPQRKEPPGIQWIGGYVRTNNKSGYGSEEKSPACYQKLTAVPSEMSVT